MQAAFALAAFNLVCRVQAYGDDVSPAVSERVVTYRVDPLLGRWCFGDCPAAWPILAMSGSEIVFERTFYGHHLMGRSVRVGWPTGRFIEAMIDMDLVERPMTVGQCERAAFGGFPSGSLPRYGPLIVAVPTRLDQIRRAATPR
jgi:hypothetical protein